MWQSEAGVDLISGARSLGRVISAPGYRRSIGGYIDSLKSGESLTNSLRRQDLLVAGELAQILHAGEQSGRLAQSLRHYLDVQAASLERLTTAIFTWIPRLYYLVVIVIVAVTLI